jgi:hypothetical protein
MNRVLSLPGAMKGWADVKWRPDDQGCDPGRSFG